MSKSQEKREQRRKDAAQLKQQNARVRVAGIAIVAVFCALILGAVGSFIYYRMTTTVSGDDYSARLNDDGTIKDVIPADRIEIPDYKNITVPLSDVEFTDEEVDASIESLLTQHREADTDPSLTAADGDTLNIDYVGTVDGVPFEGGDSGGTGYDLTLGSGSFIDDFEDQLIGSHPGDQVTVEVTFPEDYTETSLSGKDAVFEVTVNSIYVLPAFDDAFVKEHLSEQASTVEEYRTYLKETNYDANLHTTAENYIMENSSALSHDEKYIDNLKSTIKFQQEQSYEYNNMMYQMYYGMNMFNSFTEYTGMTNEEFEAHLSELAASQSAADMTCQYIFETEGLTISEEEYTAKAEEVGAESAEIYGKGYLMQLLIKEKVVDYLASVITVEQ
ncbi:MAG: trigger factor [Lachnospiraceae bacterium]|nr:trigger factor [Lachnospiraceae bacterium]